MNLDEVKPDNLTETRANFHKGLDVILDQCDKFSGLRLLLAYNTVAGSIENTANVVSKMLYIPERSLTEKTKVEVQEDGTVVFSTNIVK